MTRSDLNRSPRDPKKLGHKLTNCRVRLTVLRWGSHIHLHPAPRVEFDTATGSFGGDPDRKELRSDLHGYRRIFGR